MTSLEPTVADHREAMAVLSEAVVTRDTVLGYKEYDNCLEDSTLICPYGLRGTAFQAVVWYRHSEGFALGYDRFA